MEDNRVLYEDLIDYLEDNLDTLKDMVSQCCGYNGSLEDYYWWENDDEFYDTMFRDNMEVARAVYFGGDDYNFTDDYVRFNAYGNLETCSEWSLEDDLKSNIEEILDEFLELYSDNNVCMWDDTFKGMITDYYNTNEDE